jgi:hypothetical protein
VAELVEAAEHFSDTLIETCMDGGRVYLHAGKGRVSWMVTRGFKRPRQAIELEQAKKRVDLALLPLYRQEANRDAATMPEP